MSDGIKVFVWDSNSTTPKCYALGYDVAAPDCDACFLRVECKEETLRVFQLQSPGPVSEENQLILRIRKKVAEQWGVQEC